MTRVCTFFGHRECPSALRPALDRELRRLVNAGVTQFYLGHHGQFDALVLASLQQLKTEFPHISYAVVLSRCNATVGKEHDGENTLYPEEVACVPPRFAIDRRNRWMLQQADIVVTHTVYPWGGAARFADLAKRKGKTVINLAL